MELPGYTAEQKRLLEEAEKLREQKEKEAAAEKEKVAETKKQKLAQAAFKLEQDKKDIIREQLRPSHERAMAGITPNADGLREFMRVMGIGFLIGNAMWLASKIEPAPAGLNVTHLMYDEDMSYGQALKNAYFFDGVRGIKEDPRGLMQSIAGLVVLIMAISSASKARSKAKSDASVEKFNFNSQVEGIYATLELLKQPGMSDRRDDAVKGYDVGGGIARALEKVGDGVLSKLSEKDRGYIDNLLAGGLNDVTYKTAVAIIQGHLQSHPQDYIEIIKVIDAATLPTEMNEKYGKTISLGAAEAIVDAEKQR